MIAPAGYPWGEAPTPEAAELADWLTAADRALFINARTYPSGVWLGGPCKHLYPANLCRLTGELTALGLAVRALLLKDQSHG